MGKQNNLEKSHIVLFVYWFALLIWQNVRSVGNRGGVDTMIKAGLIMLLVFYFCFNVQRLKIDALVASVLLAVFSVVTLVSSGGITFSSLLYYLYPVFLCFIIYAVGWNAQINKKQLVSMMHWIIIMVAYIVVYALVFCRDQFSAAFSISTAYGNELSSFLVSSHEYGMYLAYGIMAIFLCMEFSGSISWRKRILYITGIVVFAVNLVLTFSRTSLVAFSAMFAVYTFFCANKTTKRILLLAVLAMGLTIVFVPQLREFVVSIVFKDGNDAGRGELTELGFSLFKDASLFQKIFGDTGFGDKIATASGHGSLHNGYIQMLVSNGLKGVVFLLVLMINSFRGNKSVKNCSNSEKNLCRLFNGFLLASAFFMLTNTSVLFQSNIDSYFLSLFTVIIPKYVRNAINAGTYE